MADPTLPNTGPDTALSSMQIPRHWQECILAEFVHFSIPISAGFNLKLYFMALTTVGQQLDNIQSITLPTPTPPTTTRIAQECQDSSVAPIMGSLPRSQRDSDEPTRLAVGEEMEKGGVPTRTSREPGLLGDGKGYTCKTHC